MYSPKIDEALIPELYKLKQSTKKPMTHLVNEAVKEYLKQLQLTKRHKDANGGKDELDDINHRNSSGCFTSCSSNN